MNLKKDALFLSCSASWQHNLLPVNIGVTLMSWRKLRESNVQSIATYDPVVDYYIGN